jgi:hypothetical protein
VGTNTTRFYSLTHLTEKIKETFQYWENKASPELKEFVLRSNE